MTYGALINNTPYGGWSSGFTYKLNDGYTDAGEPIPFSLTSKPFDEGVGMDEKEYFAMHLQGYIGTGANLAVSVSIDDRGNTFVPIDTLTPDTVSYNKNMIIPLDTVALTPWMRYRLEGEGYVELNKIQREMRVQPTQI